MSSRYQTGRNRAGTDERPQATESAEALCSRLTTVTMDRDSIGPLKERHGLT